MLEVTERELAKVVKAVDLHIRPIHHRTADRVRAHVLLCMLAYYVEWHMRKLLAPVLFDDCDPAAGQALQTSPVAPSRLRCGRSTGILPVKRESGDAFPRRFVHGQDAHATLQAHNATGSVAPAALGGGFRVW